MECPSIIKDPFLYGAKAFQQGWSGKRVSLSGRVTDLTNARRAKALFVGFWLSVPIINMLVYGILKMLRSQFVAEYSLPVHFRLWEQVKEEELPFDEMEPSKPSLVPPNPHLPQEVGIHWGAVSKTPSPIDYRKLRKELNAANPRVLPGDLTRVAFPKYFKCFRLGDTICCDDPIQHNRYESTKQPITKQAAIRRLNDYLINFLSEDPREGEIFAQIRLLLKGVVLALRRDHFDGPYIRRTLRDLVRGAGHCIPRRLEEVERCYKRVMALPQTLEQVVLEEIQGTKEEMFTDWFPSLHAVQMLNSIRRTVGIEFGLNTDPVHLEDPHLEMIAEISHSDLSTAFREFYTPANLILRMRPRLNDRISSIYVRNAAFDYLRNRINEAVAERILTIGDLEAFPKPYFDDEVRLTDAGVRFFLTDFGFLVPREANNHFIRVRE